MDLSIEIAPRHQSGLKLANPVMAASGTFGYGTEYASLIDIQQLGAIVCKGTTLRARDGNPQPRLVETPGGLLNSIGLQNIGVESVIREKAPIWAKWQVPIIVNIAAESVEEYAAIAEKLEGVEGISAVEVNISCPNSRAGGLEFGTDGYMAKEVTMAVTSSTTLPVIVKLTPNVTDMLSIARAVVDGGAHALTVSNTIAGMAVDIRRRRPALGLRRGGLSGPAVKPIALNLVYLVSQAVEVPVIGCGGIGSTQDALEFLMAGATAVQIGTANFVDPTAMPKTIEGIEKYMEEEGFETVGDIIGLARAD